MLRFTVRASASQERRSGLSTYSATRVSAFANTLRQARRPASRVVHAGSPPCWWQSSTGGTPGRLDTPTSVNERSATSFTSRGNVHSDGTPRLYPATVAGRLDRRRMGAPKQRRRADIAQERIYRVVRNRATRAFADHPNFVLMTSGRRKLGSKKIRDEELFDAICVRFFFRGDEGEIDERRATFAQSALLMPQTGLLRPRIGLLTGFRRKKSSSKPRLLLKVPR